MILQLCYEYTELFSIHRWGAQRLAPGGLCARREGVRIPNWMVIPCSPPRPLRWPMLSFIRTVTDVLRILLILYVLSTCWSCSFWIPRYDFYSIPNDYFSISFLSLGIFTYLPQFHHIVIIFQNRHSDVINGNARWRELWNKLLDCDETSSKYKNTSRIERKHDVRGWRKGRTFTCVIFSSFFSLSFVAVVVRHRYSRYLRS